MAEKSASFRLTTIPTKQSDKAKRKSSSEIDNATLANSQQMHQDPNMITFTSIGQQSNPNMMPTASTGTLYPSQIAQYSQNLSDNLYRSFAFNMSNDQWNRHRHKSNASEASTSISIAPADLHLKISESIKHTYPSSSDITQDQLVNTLHLDSNASSSSAVENFDPDEFLHLMRQFNHPMSLDTQQMEAPLLANYNVQLSNQSTSNRISQDSSLSAGMTDDRILSALSDQYTLPLNMPTKDIKEENDTPVISSNLASTFNRQDAPDDTSSSNHNLPHKLLQPIQKVLKPRSRRLSAGDAGKSRMKPLSKGNSKKKAKSLSADTFNVDDRVENQASTSSNQNQFQSQSKVIKMEVPIRSASDSEDVIMTIRHICPYPNCDKDFSTSGHARRHSRIHETFRQYGCPHQDCEATFTRRDNCRQHQLNAHDSLLDPIKFEQ